MGTVWGDLAPLRAAAWLRLRRAWLGAGLGKLALPRLLAGWLLGDAPHSLLDEG